MINRAVFANYNVVISKTHFSAWSEVQSSTSTKKLSNFYCQQESKKNKTKKILGEILWGDLCKVAAVTKNYTNKIIEPYIKLTCHMIL